MPRGSEPLTRERVLRAAVLVLDGEGLDALSMRRVGLEVGVEAMSLYRYVSDKADLLDGIHGALLDEIAIPRAGQTREKARRRASDAWWSDAVRAYAHAFRKVLLLHPNALPLFATRPAVTTSSLRHVEAGLSLLRSAGFGVDDAISAFQIVVTFVVGHTLSTHGPVREGERSAPRYEELSPAEYPALVEAAAALARHDVTRELELGLDLLLEGLGARLRAHRVTT